MQLANGQKMVSVEKLRGLLRELPGSYYVIAFQGNLQVMKVTRDGAKTIGIVNFATEVVDEK